MACQLGKLRSRRCLRSRCTLLPGEMELGIHGQDWLGHSGLGATQPPTLTSSLALGCPLQAMVHRQPTLASGSQVTNNVPRTIGTQLSSGCGGASLAITLSPGLCTCPQPSPTTRYQEGGLKRPLQQTARPRGFLSLHGKAKRPRGAPCSLGTPGRKLTANSTWSLTDT